MTCASCTVAPLAGARIETGQGTAGTASASSLPSRERELKPRTAPRTVSTVPSLPSRERELKHPVQAND